MSLTGSGAAEAIALFVAHTHAHDAADISPILAVTSPEKRCGKSNLLILLQFLVPRPLPTSNVTSAALYRAVEFFHPCLLIDEGDSFLTDKEDLRGILNSGHNRALAIVIRTVGDDHEPRAFSTWSPKVIALIGQLSDTLVDRSIDVRMQRKLAHEYVERMPTHRELLETTEDLRRKLARWAQDNSDALESGDPEIPTELHDRARDNWRPLLSVADLVGGRWPSRAREAALHLSGLVEEDSSLAVLLLSDLRDHFRDNFPDDRFSSTLSANVHETRSTQRIRVGRRQRNQGC